MKLSRVIQALAGAVALGFGANAAAVPVTFDLADGPGSSVSITDMSTSCVFGGCGASVALNPLLGSQSATLSAGQSFSFDFFSLDFYGLGSGEGTLSASLGFDAPSGAPNADGSASGSFFNFFFLFSGGELNWTSQPELFSLADGTSYSVQFNDLTGITWGSNVNVSAVLTLISEPTAVPEPGALALFGVGLLGMGFAARRRRV